MIIESKENYFKFNLFLFCCLVLLSLIKFCADSVDFADLVNKLILGFICFNKQSYLALKAQRTLIHFSNSEKEYYTLYIKKMYKCIQQLGRRVHVSFHGTLLTNNDLLKGPGLVHCPSRLPSPSIQY